MAGWIVDGTGSRCIPRRGPTRRTSAHDAAAARRGGGVVIPLDRQMAGGASSHEVASFGSCFHISELAPVVPSARDGLKHALSLKGRVAWYDGKHFLSRWSPGAMGSVSASSTRRNSQSAPVCVVDFSPCAWTLRAHAQGMPFSERRRHSAVAGRERSLSYTLPCTTRVMHAGCALFDIRKA